MDTWIFQILQNMNCISRTVSYSWEKSGYLTKNATEIVLKEVWHQHSSFENTWTFSDICLKLHPLSKEGPADIYNYLECSDMSWSYSAKVTLAWYERDWKWWGVLGHLRSWENSGSIFYKDSPPHTWSLIYQLGNCIFIARWSWPCWLERVTATLTNTKDLS